MTIENAVPSQVIWVSPNGDDANSGAADAPLASIQLAIDRATPGTAILLAPGDYTGNLVFEKIQGTPDKPIWLAAADGPGTVTITAATDTASVITIRGEDNLIIRDLTTVGGYDGIEISQSGTDFSDLVNNVVVRGNTVIGAANDGIKVGQASHVLVADNLVDGAGDQGLDLLGVTDAVVDGNEFRNITGSSGMFVKGGSSDVLITNNYIHDVSGDGLLIGGWSNADAFLPGTDYEARNVTAIGNVVENAVKRPLTVHGAQEVDIHGNYFGTADTNEYVVLVGAGSPELSPPPPSENVAIHDNVFDRGYTFADIDPDSVSISIFDNATDGVIAGDVRPYPPSPAAGGFVDTLPQSLLDQPIWATSARSTHNFTAGSGNQTLTGTDGNDFLSGGSGDDVTIGGAGDDVHSIGSSRDVAIEYPDEGIDTAIVYIKKYALADNVENMTVAYQSGGTYSGNALNNILAGGAGDDRLTGGGGDDLFVAVPGRGDDHITDFGGGDRVDLRAFAALHGLDDVLARTIQVGADVVIALDGGTTFTLEGVASGDLTADSFLFAPVPGATNAQPTAIELSGNSVVEGSAAGTVVGTLSGSDGDPGDRLTYWLLDNPDGLFAIDDNRLIVIGTLDYDTGHSHQVTVRATDLAYNAFDQVFTVEVADLAPTLPSDTDDAPNEIVEGAATGTAVGLTVFAEDAAGGAVTYSLGDDAGGRFVIDPQSGVVTVGDGSLIDYEAATSYDIVATATDSAGVASDMDFTIAIANVDGVVIYGTGGADIVDQFQAPAGEPLPTIEADIIKGGGGNDILNGLGGDDLLFGGPGADALNGGDGIDTVSYGTAHGGVQVSLATGTGTAGDAAGDILWNIENLIGSSYADTLEGDGGANTIAGGDGVDTISYEHAAAGVAVSLAAGGPQDTGGAGVDTLSGFEYLTGSGFDDSLTGEKGRNVLNGGDGNDWLNGGAGDDLLVGGSGNDAMMGGSGADWFYFGKPSAGFDTIVDFTSGEDLLRIGAVGFGGGLSPGGSVDLVAVDDSADASGADGQGYFIFDQAGDDAGTVYWDPTGGASDDAIALLTVLDSSLVASDFSIV